MIKHLFIAFTLFLVVLAEVNPAEIEPFKNRICPEVWSMNDIPIPVMRGEQTPWENSTDRSQGRAHIAGVEVVETIDGLPITLDLLTDDALTVASECLAFRNKAVNGEQFFPPAGSVTHRPEMGFISASMF